MHLQTNKKLWNIRQIRFVIRIVESQHEYKLSDQSSHVPGQVLLKSILTTVRIGRIGVSASR